MQVKIQLLQIITKITNKTQITIVYLQLNFLLLLQFIEVEFKLACLWSDILRINLSCQFVLNFFIII